MDKFVLFIKSYWYLMYFYIALRKRGLQKVVAKIEQEQNSGTKKRKEQDVVSGFHTACSWHFFNVECLERSLVLYKLLKSSNYDSRFCIGVRRKPFLSHAWVETSIRELDESNYRDKFHVILMIPKGEGYSCQ